MDIVTKPELSFITFIDKRIVYFTPPFNYSMLVTNKISIDKLYNLMFIRWTL